jgi:Histidine kinase-, DNA gyrase B-, and HSP90-like ATPase/His Kinase A (phospho-acceptor) domain
VLSLAGLTVRQARLLQWAGPLFLLPVPSRDGYRDDMILGIAADGRVDFCAGSPEDVCGLTAAQLVGCRVTMVTAPRWRVEVVPPGAGLDSSPQDVDAPTAHGSVQGADDAAEDAAEDGSEDGSDRSSGDWSGVPLDVPHEADLVCADGTAKMVTVCLSMRHSEGPPDVPDSYVVVVDQTDARIADLMATASHELRTPVTSILGYAELLRSSPTDVPPVTMQQLLGRIERNARRLKGLIEDMLMVSQVEGGGFQLDLRAVDLRQPLGRALEEIRGVLPVRELVLHTAVSECPVPVLGDADRLQRAFTHVLDNAVKFSLVGEVIDVSLGTEDGEAVVRVIDRGVGIDEAEQPHVFDRFYRGWRARELVTQGSGLGLAVTAAVVDGHGGRIEVDSAAGEGSCFTLRIPLSA